MSAFVDFRGEGLGLLLRPGSSIVCVLMRSACPLANLYSRHSHLEDIVILETWLASCHGYGLIVVGLLRYVPDGASFSAGKGSQLDKEKSNQGEEKNKDNEKTDLTQRGDKGMKNCKQAIKKKKQKKKEKKKKKKKKQKKTNTEPQRCCPKKKEEEDDEQGQ